MAVGASGDEREVADLDLEAAPRGAVAEEEGVLHRILHRLAAIPDAGRPLHLVAAVGVDVDLAAADRGPPADEGVSVGTVDHQVEISVAVPEQGDGHVPDLPAGLLARAVEVGLLLRRIGLRHRGLLLGGLLLRAGGRRDGRREEGGLDPALRRLGDPAAQRREGRVEPRPLVGQCPALCRCRRPRRAGAGRGAERKRHHAGEEELPVDGGDEAGEEEPEQRRPRASRRPRAGPATTPNPGATGPAGGAGGSGTPCGGSGFAARAATISWSVAVASVAFSSRVPHWTSTGWPSAT